MDTVIRTPADEPIGPTVVAATAGTDGLADLADAVADLLLKVVGHFVVNHTLKSSTRTTVSNRGSRQGLIGEFLENSTTVKHFVHVSTSAVRVYWR